MARGCGDAPGRYVMRHARRRRWWGGGRGGECERAMTRGDAHAGLARKPHNAEKRGVKKRGKSPKLPQSKLMMTYASVTTRPMPSDCPPVFVGTILAQGYDWMIRVVLRWGASRPGEGEGGLRPPGEWGWDSPGVSPVTYDHRGNLEPPHPRLHLRSVCTQKENPSPRSPQPPSSTAKSR